MLCVNQPAGGSPKQAGRAEKASRAYVPRKQPLYQNCRLLAPDDQLLATCDRKKAEWYLENDLAGGWVWGSMFMWGVYATGERVQ